MNRQDAIQVVAGLLEKFQSISFEKLVRAQGMSTTGTVAGGNRESCRFNVSVSQPQNDHEIRVTVVVDFDNGSKLERIEESLTVSAEPE